MEKFNYFYCIHNKINGKFYYGVHKTNNLEDNYMGSGKRIQYAINKYGFENFTKEIKVFFDTFNEALDYESEFVNEQLLLDPSCYNLRIGGKGGFTKDESLKGTKIMLNKVWSDPEFRKRKTEAVSKKNKELHKSGILKAPDQTGTKHTEKTKKQIGDKNKISQKGEKNSQFGTCWIFNEFISMKINKDDLPLYLVHEWKKGRKMR